MAETPSAPIHTTCGTSSASPIDSLAQDHFLPILLLLPVKSILSFSMTCKKFKSISELDPLWESICRRDWGDSTVNALVYSSDNKQLPWKNLYQRVCRLDSVSCRSISPSQSCGDEVFPGPRASHSLNFVSGCFVLFGGGSEGGRHLDDTWIAHVGNGFKRLKWQKIHSGTPTGRFGHSCVVIGDFLVLFGGINDSGVRLNDTWIGEVVLHDTLGVVMSWRLLDVGPIAPLPRGAHAGCCIDNNKMLIHGGIGLSGLRHGDTWILSLSENLCFGTWHEVVAYPSPPPRSGHSLTYTGGSKTVLFGGRGVGYGVLNDVWLFDGLEGHMKWIQLPFELQNIPEGRSLPRVGHSTNLILGGRLLVYGGEDSDRHRKNDFWLLDVNSVSSVHKQAVPPNTVGSLAFMWRKLNCNGYKPKNRSFHQACTDHAGRFLYIFGGMVDGVIQPSEAAGLMFDGEFFLVDLGLHT